MKGAQDNYIKQS